MKTNRIQASILAALSLLALSPVALAQEQSVRPGISAPYVTGTVEEFAGKFEVESREHFARRAEIVAGCEPKVRGCEDFRDALRHLTQDGAAAVARDIGEHYARLHQ
jgi:hypothetical protein